MKVGQSYVFHVVPGWIFSGRVVEITANRKIVIEDGAYLEAIEDGSSCWDAAVRSSAVTTGHPLPNGTEVSDDAITVSVPADEDQVKAINQRRAKKILKGAK